jgi:hypothetical protein
MRLRKWRDILVPVDNKIKLTNPEFKQNTLTFLFTFVSRKKFKNFVIIAQNYQKTANGKTNKINCNGILYSQKIFILTKIWPRIHPLHGL